MDKKWFKLLDNSGDGVYTDSISIGYGFSQEEYENEGYRKKMHEFKKQRLYYKVGELINSYGFPVLVLFKKEDDDTRPGIFKECLLTAEMVIDKEHIGLWKEAMDSLILD